jgi:hypothetical protein
MGIEPKQRTIRLMTGRNSLKLCLSKRRLLCTVGLITAALSILYGPNAHAQSLAQVQSLTATLANLASEAASIGPDKTNSRESSQPAHNSDAGLSMPLHGGMQGQERQFCPERAWYSAESLEYEAESLLPYLYLFLPLFILVVVVRGMKESG